MNLGQLKVNIQDLPDVTCPECECPHFIMTIGLKKVSALQSPTGVEQWVSVPGVLVCLNCGKPMDPEKEEGVESKSEEDSIEKKADSLIISP